MDTDAGAGAPLLPDTDAPRAPGADAPRGLDSLALLRLLQLTSPALPVGAFAYSHGLEWAVFAGHVRGAADVEDWIGGLLEHGWSHLDVPVLARLYDAMAHGDHDALAHWRERLCASRESAELLAEDLHLGQALARLGATFGVPGTAAWVSEGRCPFALALAALALHWGVPREVCALGCLWTYVEHLTQAAVKLVPLGQTEGQGVLHRIAAAIPAAVARGLALEEGEIGAALPGLAIASALHEHQYTRLFRS